MSQTITKKPFSIELVGPGYKIFQQACSLVRSGYIIAPELAPVIMPASGQVTMTLILGTPQTYAEEDAAASIKLGLELEEAEFERRVIAEAKRIVEQEKADAIRKKLETEAAEHRKAMLKLQKELETTQAAQAAIQ